VQLDARVLYPFVVVRRFGIHDPVYARAGADEPLYKDENSLGRNGHTNSVGSDRFLVFGIVMPYLNGVCARHAQIIQLTQFD
jgi:hypothetical protein